MPIRGLILGAAVLAPVFSVQAEVVDTLAGSYAGAYAGSFYEGAVVIDPISWDFTSGETVSAISAYSSPLARTDVRTQSVAWQTRAEILSTATGVGAQVGAIAYSGMSINQVVEGAPGTTARITYSFRLDGSFTPGPAASATALGAPQSVQGFIAAYRGQSLGRQYVSGSGWQDYRAVATTGELSLLLRDTHPEHVSTLLDSRIGLASVCFGDGLGCEAAGPIDRQLDLSFDVEAGEEFFISTALFAQTNGQLDFWNTMELTSIVVPTGFTLIVEDGGLLEQRPDGSYGLPAVPEPASWAMMIAGFGLVGGMARRRRVLA